MLFKGILTKREVTKEKFENEIKPEFFKSLFGKQIDFQECDFIDEIFIQKKNLLFGTKLVLNKDAEFILKKKQSAGKRTKSRKTTKRTRKTQKRQRTNSKK